MAKKPKPDRLKPISLHPLSPDEALRGAMQAGPMEKPKPKKRKARKGGRLTPRSLTGIVIEEKPKAKRKAKRKRKQ